MSRLLFRREYARVMAIPGWSDRMDALIVLMNRDSFEYLRCAKRYYRERLEHADD